MRLHTATIIAAALISLAACTTDVRGPSGSTLASDAHTTLPTTIELHHGEIRRVDSAAPCVALTFDDGPDRVLTPRLLEILAAANVHATFFLVGARVQQSPQIAADILAGGHQIGNHSWTHPMLTQLTDAEVRRQIQLTDAAILSATGIIPTIIRLPYDASSARVLSLLDRPVIYWDVDTLDWKYRSADRIIDTVLRYARPGSIILLHDIHPTTVGATPALIEAIRAKGMDFVTVAELMSGRGCPRNTSGTEYASALLPAPQ